MARLVAAVLAVATMALTTLACSSPDERSTMPGRPSRTLDYLPGRAADVYLPSGARRVAAVVLLVPGGGWETADRRGLGPLAQRLARAGIVAVNISYRTAADGVRFPAPVADIACAASFAVQQAGSQDGQPRKLVVLGHSAGAQLGAVVALSGDRFRGDCPYPAAPVDGFVGISGPYDVRAVADVAVALFGVPPEQDVAAWRDGDPLTWVADAPRGLRVLLLHGDSDTLVPPEQSRAFAGGLARGGVNVELRMVSGADHLTVFEPSFIASTVIAWVRDLTGRPAS